VKPLHFYDEIHFFSIEMITDEAHFRFVLQKYRLYLKKATPHDTNMVAGLGGGNDSYLRMRGIDGYADFCTSTRSGRIASTTLPSYAPSGVFGRLNSPAGLNMRGINSSTLIQTVQSQNINSSWIPANQSSSLLHGVPSELNQSKLNNSATGISQLNQIDSTGFVAASDFHDSRAINNSNQVSNHHLLLQGNSQQTHNAGSFRNESSVGSASLGNKNITICGSSNWQSQAQLPKFPASSLPVCKSFNNDQLPLISVTAYNQSPLIANSPVDFSSGNTITVALEEARNVPRCQEDGLIGNFIQPSSYAPRQSWAENKPDYSQNTSRPFNPVNSQVCSSRALANSASHNINQSKTVCSNRVDASFVDQVYGASTSVARYPEVQVNSNDAYKLEKMRSQVGYVEGFGTLEDIMGAIVKRV